MANTKVPMVGMRRFIVTTVVVLLVVATPTPFGLRPPLAPTDPGATPAPARANHRPIVFARNGRQPTDDVGIVREGYRGALLLASEIYEGIDLVLHRSTGEPEYDFVVRPNARADLIRLWMTDADRLEIDEHGDLVVHHAGGQTRQGRPHAHQDTPAGRIDVRADYRIGPDGGIRFALGRYDRSRPLVIRPTLRFPAQLAGASED